MHQTLKKKIKMLMQAVVLCIFAFLLLMIYIPKMLGYQTFYIETDSMKPTIASGSLVFVKKTEFSAVSEGDVMTFKSDNGEAFFTHRVVEIDAQNQMFTTKGDANKENDPKPTSYYFAVGRVEFSIPKIGNVVRVLRSTPGKIALGAIYIAWLAVEIELYVMKRKALQED